MNFANFLDYLRRNLKWVVRLSLAALVLLVVLGAIPAVVDKHHAHTKAEHVPGFWAAFGFLGCLVVFFFSKAYGRLGIMTREDYYDE